MLHTHHPNDRWYRQKSTLGWYLHLDGDATEHPPQVITTYGRPLKPAHENRR